MFDLETIETQKDQKKVTNQNGVTQMIYRITEKVLDVDLKITNLHLISNVKLF